MAHPRYVHLVIGKSSEIIVKAFSSGFKADNYVDDDKGDFKVKTMLLE